MPRTQWRTTPYWLHAEESTPCRASPLASHGGSQVAAAVPDPSAHLLRTLQDKLEVGHWRVACRRFLMMLARDYDVPEPYATRCAALLERCSAREIARMQADARSWADLLPSPGRS